MRSRRMPLQTRRPVARARPFPPRRDYTSLSLRDLLDARDAYHVHLSMLENVTATAIGRYLIHRDDWYATHAPGRPRPADYPRVREARTLENSVLRPWSWPAVLVFVKRWEEERALGPELVPPLLYLPDGRVVPTCVVEAAPDESLPRPAPGPFHPSPLLGGGYACLREHQGERSLGTFACLVRKGGSYYALTNRHVAGGDGEQVSAYVRGAFVRVGRTSSIAVDRLLMSAAFPEWPGERTYLTLDAGLIRVDDIDDWTSQAFGIGEIGEVFDATAHSITLDLIGCPVRAFGGISGVAEGEIRALFFRYQSLGGFDYATDVLIAPRPGDTRAGATQSDKPLTRPGDSGTLWFYDPPLAEPETEDADLPTVDVPPEHGARARRLRPIAMQWGGQRVLTPDARSSAYALASFLSTICRALDVEVVRSWSTGHDEYWGKIGHFAIGWKACEHLSGALSTLMMRNQARIGFGADRLGAGSGFHMGRGEYVPLADVPDYVWLLGRDNEGIQHFADVDIQDIDGRPSLLERCVEDPANVSAPVWKAYFDGFAAAGVGPEEGALPFRVWQIWESMVDFLRQGDVKRFVAAAGILSHYIGDASQPLHASYLHHGRPPMTTIDGRQYPLPRSSPEFQAFKKSREAKIHAIYEETMLEVDTVTLLAEVDGVLAHLEPPPLVRTGHAAGVASVALMAGVHKRLAPETIIDADTPSLPLNARAAALWNNAPVRKATIRSLSASVRLLAVLWKSAWKQGGGNQIPSSALVAFSEQELEDVYRHDAAFLPSLSLEEMATSGRFEPPAG